MKKQLRILICGLTLLLLVPSAWAGDSKKKDKVSNGRVQIMHLTDDYIIGQGDVLDVFVWRNELLSQQVVVRPDGKISLPLIQDLQAAGFTAVQLKDQITRTLSEYIDNPRVSVIISEIKSYRVSVLGQVRNPGVYPITGKTTFVEAISLAGGFTEWANKSKITLITNEGGNERKHTVNYKKIASGKDPSQNIVLKRGDIIIVP